MLLAVSDLVLFDHLHEQLERNPNPKSFFRAAYITQLFCSLTFKKVYEPIYPIGPILVTIGRSKKSPIASGACNYHESLM